MSYPVTHWLLLFVLAINVSIYGENAELSLGRWIPSLSDIALEGSRDTV